mmetsp:Transcript_16674/g.22126  ORF Transcript_16674/g.22126 Transcript_16674/m.22126 type:complete len:575 (-) Transcript_16674:134-1858(-)
MNQSIPNQDNHSSTTSSYQSTTSTNTSKGGTIALPNLPSGTSLTLDGTNRILSSPTTFLGITSIPTSTFHLLCVRKPNDDDPHHGGGSAVGFIAYSKEEKWCIIRDYNSQTEEPNAYEAAADEITRDNFIKGMEQGCMSPDALIGYFIFCEEHEKYKRLSDYISLELLQLRKLHHGDKIVPAAYTDTTDADSTTALPDNSSQTQDGKEVFYPPIPCIHPTLSPSLHSTKHNGTIQFLKNLKPCQRSAFFLKEGTSGDFVFGIILDFYYNYEEDEMLGDVQLCFLCFLYLGCFTSLTHWRDLLSMISFTSSSNVVEYTSFYKSLLQILIYQLSFIEVDFFEEVEYSNNNFLIPALQRLCSICSLATTTTINDDDDDEYTSNATNKKELEEIQTNVKKLQHVMYQRFRVKLTTTDSAKKEEEEEEEEDVLEVDMEHGVDVSMNPFHANKDDGNQNDDNVRTHQHQHDTSHHHVHFPTDDDNNDEEDDGPTIVSFEEIKASMARITASSEQQSTTTTPQDQEYQKQYPLLYAAKTPKEDIVMTCARVLEDALDVSLVREASSYLEEVEVYRGQNRIE